MRSVAFDGECMVERPCRLPVGHRDEIVLPCSQGIGELPVRMAKLMEELCQVSREPSGGSGRGEKTWAGDSIEP